MENIKLKYNDNEKIIFLNYFTSEIFIDDNFYGFFIIDNGILTIKWINNIIEKFQYDQILNLYNFISNIKIDIENNITNFQYEYIEENTIKIKLNEKYDSLFKLNENNIFVDITDNYNEKIFIENESWSGTCIINKWNNYFYRENLPEENGKFSLDKDILILYWDKWDNEKFYLSNNTYIKIKKYNIQIYHKDWIDECIIDHNILYKISDNNEIGKFLINNNQLEIDWEKWNSEIFFNIDNIYYLDYYIYKIIIDNGTNDNNILVYNKYNSKIYNISNYNYIGDIIIDNELYLTIKYDNNYSIKYYYKINNKEYLLYEYINRNIIINKYFNETIILNIIDNTFITENNNQKNGKYKFILDENLIELYFLSDNTIEIYKLYNNVYYYEEYIRLHNTIIYLLNGINIIEYKINSIDNLLYNILSFEKIKFIRNNDIFIIIENNILKKYYLKSINEKYILTNNEEEINLNILRTFINDFTSSDLDLYNKFLINNYDVYSISSFLKKYNYINIENYCKNNLLSFDKENAIIHWYKTDILSNNFYSNDKIDICYMSLNKNNIDKNLYIINFDNNILLENVIDNIPKISNLIIAININKNNIYLTNYIESLKIYFNNLCIIKYIGSYNIDNYFLFNFIINKINEQKTLNYLKIIYLKNYYENLDDIIINLNKPLNKKIYLFNDNIYIKNTILNDVLNNIFNNVLNDIKLLINNKINIIILIIFLYIIYYDIFNKNFIYEI